MHNPPIPKVNGRNEVVGETTIAEAIKNGWPRRMVRVFVFDAAGNILIHRRSDTIIGYPGFWDQAAGGHVDVGESAHEAAVRESMEEIGLQLHLTEIAAAHYVAIGETPCFSYVYRAVVPVGVEIHFDQNEIAEVRWLTLQAFENMLCQEQDCFVPVFVETWKQFRDKLIAT